MPRSKPSKVIEHRISLGTYERGIVDQAINAYTVNRIANPLVALISDVSAMAFLASAYLTYRIGPWAASQLKDKYETIEELTKDTFQILDATKDSLDQTLNYLDPLDVNPVDNLISDLRKWGIIP